MRRTKEDAEQTRKRIIAAARTIFARRGVTRTSLEQIARAARVTRGAVYWHFSNKTELFYAMRREVSLPIVDSMGPTLARRDADPLAQIERFLAGVLETIENDACTRRTFEIIAFKCEYVGGLERELEQQVKGYRELYQGLARAYRRARRAGMLRAGLQPEAAALETCAFLGGLVRLWLMDEQGDLVRRSASRMLREHVRAKRHLTKAPVQSGSPRAEYAPPRSMKEAIGHG
jgi:TetR/AcrR family acrAB operon transcriptional repressor